MYIYYKHKRYCAHNGVSIHVTLDYFSYNSYPCFNSTPTLSKAISLLNKFCNYCPLNNSNNKIDIVCILNYI